jgi:hypothetical protein
VVPFQAGLEASDGESPWRFSARSYFVVEQPVAG